MENAIHQIQSFYTRYSDADLDDLAGIYDVDIVFHDPIHVIKGLEALRRYFAAGRRGLLSCRFEFGASICSEARVSMEWKMYFSHKSLRGGAPLVVDGCSVLTLDRQSGLVVAHRDYFDLGEMLYEQVPVLGSVVRWIKSKQL